MQKSLGVHHNIQGALELITYIWLSMFLKRKIIIVAHSEGTGVLSFTHFQIAMKLVRAFENKDILVLYMHSIVLLEWKHSGVCLILNDRSAVGARI
jgi:hypothetical protein